MILDCSFEELQALTTGADALLADRETGGEGSVAAPTGALTEIAELRPRLTGALSLTTLADARRVRIAVEAICGDLHDRLEETVLQTHPAHEEAVAAYFDYAHAFGVLSRVHAATEEMCALIEVMTGAPVTQETAAGITFPD